MRVLGRIPSLAAALSSVAVIFCSTTTSFATAFVPTSTSVVRGNHHLSIPRKNGQTSNLPAPVSSCRSQRRQASASSSRHRHQLQAASAVAMGALSSIGSPLGAVSVLAFVVLIHELGHYLSARYFGIKVEEFSIGVGPKIMGFAAFGNDFSLRAIPLGGYVRFPENYDADAVRKLDQAAAEAAQERRSLLEKERPYLKIVNLLTLGISDELLRRKQKNDQLSQIDEELQALETSSEPKSFWGALSPKNKKKSELLQKQKSMQEEDPEDFEIDYYDDETLLQNRPWFERAVVLSGGVIMNFVLAFVLYFGAIAVGPGIPQPTFDNGVVVNQAPRQGAAAYGVLQQGDILVGINGRAIQLAKSKKIPPPVLGQQEVAEVVNEIRSTPDGQSISLIVQKDFKQRTVNITPQRASQNAPQTIGVLLGPNFVKMDTIRVTDGDILQALSLAWNLLSQTTQQTLDGLILFFVGLASGQNTGSQATGPVGLIQTGSQVVKTQDLAAVILFASGLSINLGIINALPVPALDGGQLVFVIAEAVTGRKINQRVQEGITSVGVLFLLWLTVSNTFSDVGSIISGR